MFLIGIFFAIHESAILLDNHFCFQGIMEPRILPFRKKYIIFWVSGGFYLILFLLYFLIVNYQHYYVPDCPIYDPFEANFFNQECEQKYAVIFKIETQLFLFGFVGYCLLFFWSLIRGFLRLKADKIQSFSPFLIQIMMGLFFVFTYQWWVIELLW